MNSEIVPLKQRMVETYIKNALVYKELFLEKSYLVYSSKMKLQEYYILEAKKSNYLHLTGIETPLNPDEFWNKCTNRTLNDTDITTDWTVLEKDEKNKVKGNIKRKLIALDLLESIFNTGRLEIEEDFKKNRIICKIGISESNITLGYTGGKKMYPKSLLKNNLLKVDKKIMADLLVMKDINSEKYDQILFGNISTIQSNTPVCDLIKNT